MKSGAVAETLSHAGGPGFPGKFVFTVVLKHFGDSVPCTLSVATCGWRRVEPTLRRCGPRCRKHREGHDTQRTESHTLPKLYA